MAVPQDNRWVNGGSVGSAEWETFVLPLLPIPTAEKHSQFISRPINIPWDVKEWSLDFREIILPTYYDDAPCPLTIKVQHRHHKSDVWEDFEYGTVYTHDDDKIDQFRYIIDFAPTYQIQCPYIDMVGHDLNNERFVTMYSQPHFRKETSYIRKDAPTTNYVTDDYSYAGFGASSSVEYRALLRFPLDKYEAKWELDDVYMQLYNLGVGSPSIAVYRITSDWDETAVTWNNRKTGVAWGTPGGDIDGDPIFTFSVGDGLNMKIGSSDGDFRTAIKEAIADMKPYYGLMFVADFYEPNTYAKFYSMHAVPSNTEDDRINAKLILRTSDNYEKLMEPLTDNPLASEFRVFKGDYVLDQSGQHPPYDLSTGIPRLKNVVEITNLVTEYSIEQSRSDIADSLTLDVIDDEAGTYAGFWNPMDVIVVFERVIGSEHDNSFIKKGTFVIDSDPESVEAAMPTLRVSARNCAKYGLLTACQGKWEADLIEVAQIELTLVDETGDFRIYKHLTDNGDYAYNWNQTIPPGVFSFDASNNKLPYQLKDGIIFVVYGEGAVYISTEAWNTSVAEGGLGQPAHVYATYTRWKTPVDSFTGCNALHKIIYDVLMQAGYQHTDSTAINYIKTCMPILSDFVFDRVYNKLGSTYIDITGTIEDPKVQKETDSPKLHDDDMVALQSAGDALYFMLTVDNHRFTHIYTYLKTIGTGGSYIWEVYNGTTWTAVDPISSEAYNFADLAAYEKALDNWIRRCWQDSRWAYEQDDKASSFESSGVVAFDETDLQTWKAVKLSDLDATVPITTDPAGFWMRCRCVTPSSTAVELHRFAGKEVVILPSDNKTNIARIWDDKKHLELIDEWLGQFAPPNYYLQVNEHGDVDTAYIMQQNIAAYEIVNDFTVSRERNDSQIYTQVNVRLSESNRDSLVDYSKSMNGATCCYSGYVNPEAPEEDLKIAYTYEPGNGYTYDQDDMYALCSGDYHPSYAIDQSLTSCGFWVFGGGKGSPDGGTRNGKPMPGDHNTPALAERDVLIVVLPQEVRLFRVSCKASGHGSYNGTYSISVRAEAPGSPWIPTLSKVAATNDMRDIKSFDFTQDADPNLPAVKYIKFHINSPAPINNRPRGSHTHPYSYTVAMKVYNIIAEGIAVSEPVYASATLGTTPPFDTNADKALMDKYRIRAMNISDKNAYLTNIDDANAYALNVLREAYRLYDPLAVGNINPYAQIGQTVRYKNSILSVDKVNGALYVIEEISHKRGGEVETRLVPYRG
jgi:hypothetical protein